jgi:predicted amidohydrolase
LNLQTRKFQNSSQTEGKNYNTQVILDDKGEIRSVYDKMHLFEINLENKGEGKSITHRESEYVVPGAQFNAPIQTPIGVLANGIVRTAFQNLEVLFLILDARIFLVF